MNFANAVYAAHGKIVENEARVDSGIQADAKKTGISAARRYGGLAHSGYFSDHGVAFFRLSLTLWIFCTPCVSTHLCRASAPPRTKTPTPSFQVARPQRTPQKCTPASVASSRASVKARLLTPAERKRKGFEAAAAARRKSSSACSRVWTKVPSQDEEPCT